MMRPIVKAVGLISILAHDYMIVKMKMLFRYPVTVISFFQVVWHYLYHIGNVVFTGPDPVGTFVLYSNEKTPRERGVFR